MRKKFKPGDKIETIDSYDQKKTGTIIEYEWQFDDCALVEWDKPEKPHLKKTVIERNLLKLQGQPEKQKKDKLLPIPRKPARKKPQGFTPVVANDFFDDDIYGGFYEYENDDFSHCEQYHAMKHNFEPTRQ